MSATAHSSLDNCAVPAEGVEIEVEGNIQAAGQYGSGAGSGSGSGSSIKESDAGQSALFDTADSAQSVEYARVQTPGKTAFESAIAGSNIGRDARTVARPGNLSFLDGPCWNPRSIYPET